MDFYSIAKICHEANKALCEVYDDYSQKSWEEAPEWQRDSAIESVIYVFENPDLADSGLHDQWVADKRERGWVYGKAKDAEYKTHPCIIPFEELPLHQQAKDKLFITICRALVVTLQVTHYGF